MDFGIVGLNGLGSSNNSGYASLASDPETKQKLYGSGLYKQDRSDSIDDNLRSSKLSKTGDFLASKDMLFQQRNNNCSLRSIFSDINEHQQKNQQMLSFSSPKPESFLANNCQNASLPCLYNSLSTYTRNSGYNCLNWNGAIAGARGPFTPSQWLELEHQALIYKYITSNVPIPSNLLLPIQRALDSAGLSAFSGGYLRPNRLGWGSIHLGFSNNTDPEPGRCRRTDGKKWRCSRDAVADQKYCERHLNRGRHRSRKPVEGQTGQSATRTTSMVTTKPTPMSSLALSSVALPSGLGNQVTTKPTPMSSLALSSVALPSGLGNQQLQSLELRSSNASAGGTHTNRMLLKDNDDGEKIQDTPGLFLMSKENSFLIQKQKNPYEDQSTREFGLVTSDSLLNPSQKSTSLISCRNFGSSQDLVNQEAESQHSLHQFIDDWPNKTQLSIAIPMGASTDFIPSSSSTNNEKITLSPLRLSREVDPELMGLGMGNEQNSEQTNWIPISWDQNSVGGPLGEVLNHSNNYNILEKERSSVLNLMTEGWDNSPSIGSSPTGVLQKTSFGSVSNSSAGSSPRAENNKTHEGASLCNDHLLGSTTLFSSSSSSLPAL